MFEDNDFFGDDAIGAEASGRVSGWRHPFKWRRVAELHDSAQLFGIIEAENIRQGEIGDCWLLAATAVLADFPGHVANLFETMELTGDGCYNIRLWDARSGWETITIDDRIPCDCQGTPLFAQLVGESGAVWALLLEKAMAKFVGSYSGLIGGNASWAWQVLTGQAPQARWERKSENEWIRWECTKTVREAKTSDEGHEQWRRNGMRETTWHGPAERCDDEAMFANFATYSQANFLVSCAISDGGSEEKRTDGLITRHEYSLLQVVCAHGERLVQIRNPWGKGGEWNGAWSDGSDEWRDHPEIQADLNEVDRNDGVFWMPWDAFIEIFGGDISVCPVSLPCARNSQLDVGLKTRKCRRCRQGHCRSWALCDDGEWHSLVDEGSICFLCLRASCRASNPGLTVLGVHTQPSLCLAPPKGPRRLELCQYGAYCYRRNPQHFHEYFHPSLLPPAPACEGGCGRSAASGFPSCCRACTCNPPDLEIRISTEDFRDLSGLYKPIPGKVVNRKTVWQKDGEGRGFLWLGAAWMMSYSKISVGTNSGNIAGKGGSFPHQVRQWTCATDDGWESCDMEVALLPNGVAHDPFCDERDAREQELAREADELLRKG